MTRAPRQRDKNGQLDQDHVKIEIANGQRAFGFVVVFLRKLFQK